MYDLKQIQHFVCVYRLNSFSKAADEMNVSQSTMTKSIRALEAAWDTELFFRTTRRVVPTESGKRLFPMAIELLSHADLVRNTTQRGESHLKIVSGPTILDLYIPEAVEIFRSKHSEITVIADTMPAAHAIEELVHRRAHILMYHTMTISGLPHAKRFRTEQLFSEPYMVICGSDHAVLKTDRTLEQILDFDWAIAGFDPTYAASLPLEIRELIKAKGFPKYRLFSQYSCLSLTQRSDVLTLIPASHAELFVNAADLTMFPFPDIVRYSISYAVLHDVWREPAVQNFLRIFDSENLFALHSKCD